MEDRGSVMWDESTEKWATSKIKVYNGKCWSIEAPKKKMRTNMTELHFIIMGVVTYTILSLIMGVVCVEIIERNTNLNVKDSLEYSRSCIFFSVFWPFAVLYLPIFLISKVYIRFTKWIYNWRMK